MSADFSTLVNSNMLFLLYSCSSFIFEIFVIFIYLFAYSFVCVHVCHGTLLEVGGQRAGVIVTFYHTRSADGTLVFSWYSPLRHLSGP